MSVRVQLPPILRTLSGGAREMRAEGATIQSVMVDLAKKHPAFSRHIFDEAGFLRPSIVFLHAGILVRSGDASTHHVGDGDEIVLTNALSGG